MGEPDPVAVAKFGNEERMLEFLIREGENPDVAEEMAAMAFGTSEGDIVDLGPIPPTSPSA